MDKIPTTSELADLGAELARDGFTAHEDRVATVVDVARRGEPLSVTLDALGDLTAPDVVRARAFASMTGRWDSIRRHALDSQAAFDDSFAQLAGSAC